MTDYGECPYLRKECITGIKIILKNHFPIEIINEETGEVEDVIHMVQEN